MDRVFTVAEDGPFLWGHARRNGTSMHLLFMKDKNNAIIGKACAGQNILSLIKHDRERRNV